MQWKSEQSVFVMEESTKIRFIKIILSVKSTTSSHTK